MNHATFAEFEHAARTEGFGLAPGVPHAERYGEQGATFGVARRHPPG